MKNKILVVDKDIKVLQLIEKLFQNFYVVRTAQTGNNAFEIFDKGYEADLIISDFVLPDMTGADFLNKSINFLSDSVRILIGETKNIKEISENIKHSKAYFYLPKPFIEYELIQAIKIGINQYNTQMKIIKAEEDLHLAKITTQMTDKPSNFIAAFQTISGLHSNNDRFYYRNFANSVVIISRAIGKELKMKDDRLGNLLTAAFLCTAILGGFPQNLIGWDPNELSSKQDRRLFLDTYFSRIDHIAKSKTIDSEILNILFKVWEHTDGTGIPKNLTGNLIPQESQIISIAIFYENRVYKIPPNNLEKAAKTQELLQTDIETARRHKEAIGLLNRRAKWFEYDVYRAFHELLKKSTCTEVMAITFKSEEETKEQAEQQAKQQAMQSADMIPNINLPPGSKIQFEIKEVKIIKVEKEIRVDELKPGMILGQDVYSSNGLKIYRSESELTTEMIRQIHALERMGTAQMFITIMVDQAE